MPDIEVSFDGRNYSLVVEAGSEERVHAHVRTLEQYAERLQGEHGRIERTLLVLLASILALDDSRDGSAVETIAVMEETTVALREAAGRVSLLAERIGELT